MSDTPQVDLYFSFRSPFSYLAIGRLAEWAVSEDIDLKLRPVLPLAIRTPDFFQRIDPLMPGYVRRDLERLSAFHNIPFRWAQPDPVVMQFNPIRISAKQLYIHRLTLLGVAAARQGRGVAFARHVSHLIWSGCSADWTAGDQLARAVAQAGLDLAALDQEVQRDRAALEEILTRNQEAHRASGHWGVPCMVYRDEPFFGQDRIELLQWRVAENRAGATD